MKREIKFRSWCEGTHEGLTFSTPTMEYGVILSPKGNYCDVESGWDIHGEYPTVPIMQFTGLTDKNGKEIYEGDILLTHETRIVKVIWNKPNAQFDTMFIRDSNKNRQFDGLNNCHWEYKTEVIGNIYENPELL